MKFEPPFDRLNHEIATSVPIGCSPNGRWLVSSEELPELPSPARVAVTRDFIEMDGWVFSLRGVPNGMLVWLQASFLRWVKEDSSVENRKWITGIVEALQDVVTGGS